MGRNFGKKERLGFGEQNNFESRDYMEGADWYCDECDAYLNDQSGFTVDYGEWTCEVCGHINRISEDEIYESKEDYLWTKIVKMAEEEKPGYLQWYDSGGICDSDAHEFPDWDDHDQYDDRSEDEVREIDRIIGTALGMTAALGVATYQQYKADKEIEQLKKRRKHERRAAKRKRFWSAVLHKKRISIGFSHNDCIDSNLTTVMAYFEKSGFTKINLNIMEDLEIGQIGMENIVTGVTIDGRDIFFAQDKIRYDSDVNITCHKLKRVLPPVSVKEARKMAGQDVVELFRNAGFAQIAEDIIFDLTFGLLKKDGAVENVSVGENRKYKKDIPYRINGDCNKFCVN